MNNLADQFHLHLLVLNQRARYLEEADAGNLMHVGKRYIVTRDGWCHIAERSDEGFNGQTTYTFNDGSLMSVSIGRNTFQYLGTID